MHDKQGTVYAYRQELEAWWNGRSSRLELPLARTASAERPRLRWYIAACLAAVAIVVPVAAWRLGTESDAEIVLSVATPFTSARGFEQQPSFSPDGRHVVYLAAGTDKKSCDLYVQAMDRGEPERFTFHPGCESNPAWSPDGQSIAYIRSEGSGPAELIVQPATGGNLRRIGDIRFHGQMSPAIAWAGNGEWLIVSDKPRSQEPAGLFRIHSASGELRRLTTCDATCVSDGSLAISRDGGTLAFLRTMRSGNRDVWLLDLKPDGEPVGALRQITRLDATLGPPVWLPGDREIAVSLLRDFTWTWQRLSRSGDQLRPFEAFAGLRPRPVFSPDGRYIVAPHFEDDHNIRRIDLETGEERDIIASTRIDTNPQISPDGRQIVFPSSRRGNIDLWKADAEGDHPVQIFSMPGKSSGTPRWSPDGRMIAFDVADSSSSDIYVMNADGGQARRLTDHPARDYVPSWSRDGQRIYFGSDRDGDSQVFSVSVRGGTAVRITKNGGFAGWESPQGGELYVSKTGGKTFGERSVPSLWRVQLSDGSEDPVPDVHTDWSRYSVRPDGIYFIGSGPEGANTLRVFDFRARAVRDLRALQHPSSMGFSIAPDGTWAVYTSVMASDSDLVLHKVQRR